MTRCGCAAVFLAAVAAPAAGQGDTALARRLDSIAGHWVQRKYAVGIVAAVVKGGETLLLKPGTGPGDGGRGDADTAGTRLRHRRAPARPIPRIEDLTFGRGLPRFIFRRADGDGGPVTELRFSMPGAHMILTKQ